jgi:outer membrane protein
MRTCTSILGLVITILATGNTPAAEGGEQAGRKESEWFVGAGALVMSKPYRGLDSKAYVIPVLSYEGDRLYLRGIVGGYRLFKGERWSLGPVLRPCFEGYQAEDSTALAGMRDRHPSLDAGVEWSWLADWGLVTVSLVTDVLGKHDGQELEVSYTAMLPHAGFDFIPSAGVRWRSSNLVGYYYGVQADEARAGRPAYEPGDTITPVIRLTVRRKLSARWSALGAAQYEWFGGAITDSPIVENDYAVSFILGLAYSF